MKFKIISLVALLFAFSCKTKMDASKLNEMKSSEIAKGNLYGSGSEGIASQNLVIDNETDWKALMQQMDSVNKVSESFSETRIDFSEYIVVAVFDEVRGSGGYSLELKVDSNAKNKVIHVISQAPQGNAASVMTQPYIIIKMPKTDLPILFQE